MADVGCGHGYSTLMMAEAFPNSEFVGFDFHGPSIDEDWLYDMIDEDCLYDMGDPVGAAAPSAARASPAAPG